MKTKDIFSILFLIHSISPRSVFSVLITKKKKKERRRGKKEEENLKRLQEGVIKTLEKKSCRIETEKTLKFESSVLLYSSFSHFFKYLLLNIMPLCTSKKG